MKYLGNTSFKHHQADKVGVLITNLGTPDAPTAKALRPYLKQFLWDPRVVEVPRPIWWLILNGIILNTRPKKSAHAYQTVWTEAGSPLALHTENQARLLQEKFTQAAPTGFDQPVIVDWAMRYGSPSIAATLQKMMAQGVRKLVVLPLYPQYSAATTGSTFDALADEFKRTRWLPELRFINQYCDSDAYIEALANSIRTHWQAHGQADKLVFSYHGVPLRYLHEGDPYHCQCHKTTRLVAAKLGLAEDSYITSFQSRFGREEWLKPYTDATLKSLPEKGIKSVQVICPGFSADCLETIEEIGVENRDYFLESGGKEYQYIPALNDSDEHINVLFDLLQANMQGWSMPQDNNEERDQRFKAHQHNQVT